MAEAKNVLGTNLEICCTSPMTGYYRDGLCNTGGQDFGMHVVCAPGLTQLSQAMARCSRAACQTTRR